MKQIHRPRKNLKDRYDIYNNLPHGALTKIAKQCKCSVPQVKVVLEGERNDYFGIIKAAELMAALHIWKERFCKLDKSQL